MGNPQLLGERLLHKTPNYARLTATKSMRNSVSMDFFTNSLPLTEMDLIVWYARLVVSDGWKVMRLADKFVLERE